MAERKAQVTKDAVIYELERRSILLDSDPELINAMSIDEVRHELREIGREPKSLPTDIANLISGNSGGSVSQTVQPPKAKAARAGSADEGSAGRNIRPEPISAQKTVVLAVGAAAAGLAISIVPVLHDFLFIGIADNALSWGVSLASGALIGMLGALMISKLCVPTGDTRINTVGSFVGGALPLGSSLIWILNASSTAEVAFALTSLVLAFGATLFLKWLGAAIESSNRESLGSQITPIRSSIVVAHGQWLRMKKAILSDSGAIRWAQAISAVLIICAITLATAHWGYHTSSPFGSGAHLSILVDRTLTAEDRACASYCLSQEMALSTWSTGTTVTLFATGDYSTANEPIQVANYQLYGGTRLLTRKRDTAKQRDEILSDLQNRIVRLDTNKSPSILVSLQRTVENIRSAGFTESSGYYLYVVTDIEDSAELGKKETNPESVGQPIRLTTRIDNKNIRTIVWDVGRTGSRPAGTPEGQGAGLKNEEPTDHIRESWTALFTHPELVSIESVCGGDIKSNSSSGSDKSPAGLARCSSTDYTSLELSSEGGCFDGCEWHTGIFPLDSSLQPASLYIGIPSAISYQTLKTRNFDNKDMSEKPPNRTCISIWKGK